MKYAQKFKWYVKFAVFFFTPHHTKLCNYAYAFYLRLATNTYLLYWEKQSILSLVNLIISYFLILFTAKIAYFLILFIVMSWVIFKLKFKGLKKILMKLHSNLDSYLKALITILDFNTTFKFFFRFLKDIWFFAVLVYVMRICLISSKRNWRGIGYVILIDI